MPSAITPLSCAPPPLLPPLPQNAALAPVLCLDCHAPCRLVPAIAKTVTSMPPSATIEGNLVKSPSRARVAPRGRLGRTTAAAAATPLQTPPPHRRRSASPEACAGVRTAAAGHFPCLLAPPVDPHDGVKDFADRLGDSGFQEPICSPTIFIYSPSVRICTRGKGTWPAALS